MNTTKDSRKKLIENRLRDRNIKSRNPVARPPVAVRPVPTPTPPPPQPKPDKPKALEPGLWVQVCQGLGDIFWVYQKLAPYFETINFHISIINDTSIDRRSEEWLKLLPKVGHVRCKMIKSEDYVNLIGGDHNVGNIIEQWERGVREVAYCCNRPLEEGVRLEDIDQYAPEWGVPMKFKDFPVPYREYVTLYVSGTTKSPIAARDYGIWSVDQWVEFVRLIYRKYRLEYPLALIGAEFDRDIIEEVEQRLTEQGREVTTYIQRSPERVCNLLKRSKLFIGYQSGLNIVADNLDVPQVMVYFPKLEKMQYTWCKKENIKTLFHAGIFSEGPAGFVERLEGLKV